MTKKHDIIWLESVDSTNEECKRHIQDLDNLSVVSASAQTDGKGQKGNRWHSSPEENLTFSIVLKFPCNAEVGQPEPVLAYDQFVLSEISALSVTDLLASYGIYARIKWPNDIYVDGRKICGILIENSLLGKWISHSIIGIGLNVNQRNFDVSLPDPTSMTLSCGHKFHLRELLDEFMEIFSDYFDRYCHIKGGYGRLHRLYLSQLWRQDEWADFVETATSRKFTGMIKGVSDTGHLQIETKEGELKEFAFKEISFS